MFSQKPKTMAILPNINILGQVLGTVEWKNQKESHGALIFLWRSQWYMSCSH